MNKLARQKLIRNKLFFDKKVYVLDLAKELSVTDRTIRNDLKSLSGERKCSLFHGGAKIMESRNNSLCKETSLKDLTAGFNHKFSDSPPEKKHSLNQHNDNVGVYVLGSFNIDIVSEVAVLPKVGQTVHSRSTAFYPGGKGCNQATAAAKVSDSVHFTVKVGRDEFGSKAKKYFNSTNINSFTILEDEKALTGNAMIIVSPEMGNNFITIDSGANATITAGDLINDFSLIQDASVFLTQLENNFDITLFALEYAKSCKTLVILNPAPYIEQVKGVLNLVDILTPNETEASDLSGIQVCDFPSAKQAAEVIYKMGAKRVIITLGADGCLLYDGKSHKKYEAYSAVATDTCGAGDAFNGALAAGLSKGVNLDAAIKYATAFAALAVERKGAVNMPDHSLVVSRMKMDKVPEI